MPTSPSQVDLVWDRESPTDVVVFGNDGVRSRPVHAVVITATIVDGLLRGIARGSLHESLTPPPVAVVKGHRIECPAER